MPVTALKATGALLYVTLGIGTCHLYYPFVRSQLIVVYSSTKLISRLALIRLTPAATIFTVNTAKLFKQIRNNQI